MLGGFFYIHTSHFCLYTSFFVQKLTNDCSDCLDVRISFRFILYYQLFPLSLRHETDDDYHIRSYCERKDEPCRSACFQGQQLGCCVVGELPRGRRLSAPIVARCIVAGHRYGKRPGRLYRGRQVDTLSLDRYLRTGNQV